MSARSSLVAAGALVAFWALMSYVVFFRLEQEHETLFVVALLASAVLGGMAIGRWQATLLTLFWPLVGLLPERCVVTVAEPLVHGKACSSTSYADQGPLALVVVFCLAAGVLLRRSVWPHAGSAGTVQGAAHNFI